MSQRDLREPLKGDDATQQPRSWHTPRENYTLTQYMHPSACHCCCSVTKSCLPLRLRALQHASIPLLHHLPSFFKLMSFASAILSNHFILHRPLLLLSSISPSIRVFFNESALCIRCPKYWSFSFTISPSSEYSGLFLLRLTGLVSFLSKGLSRVFSSTTVQKHQFFGTQPSL